MAVLQLDSVVIVSANKSANGQTYVKLLEIGSGTEYSLSGVLPELERVPVGVIARVAVSGDLGTFNRVITCRHCDAIEVKVGGAK